jgi:hypothetical protein
MLNNPNSRAKRCPKQLNSYIHAVPDVAERIMRGNFQTKKEHRAKAAETITEFERAFERRSD